MVVSTSTIVRPFAFATLVVAAAMLFGFRAEAAGPASLYLTPKQGSFDVGSTFEVSLVLNTNDNSVNAVEVDLRFSPETLQVVSPTGGTSFVAVWVTQPSYSNEKGTIHFAGGLPTPGITTSAGKVSTVTFRAKAPGEATVEILPTSRVLLNDGKGTNILNSVDRGIYRLTLAAPGGPTISSPTHPDQNAWYRNNNATLSWKREDGVAEYSWWLDQDPNGYADNKVDGAGTSTSFVDIPSGISFFHLKGKAGDAWGLPSSYALRIDVTPPAAFVPNVEPAGSRPGERRLVSFATTDQHSGIDHYEVSVLNLNEETSVQGFFVEQASPWLSPALGIGRHRIIVRAYDRAGNWTDGYVDIENEQPESAVLLERLSRGSLRLHTWTIPWWSLLAAGVLLLILFLVVLIVWRRRHRNLSEEMKEDIGKVHKKLQEQHERIASELREEERVSELLNQELKEIDHTKQDS